MLSTGSPSATTLSRKKPRTTSLGTKWAFFNERLELSAAIFRTDKDNTRILVATRPTTTPDNPASTAWS